MKTRSKTRNHAEGSSDEDDEETRMDCSSSYDSDDIFQEDDEENNKKSIEKPATFLQIPIIKFNNNYYMTAIYVKRFLPVSDYDLVKMLKKVGDESDRIALYSNEMKKLVQLSQHNHLCSELEIKLNNKGIVLLKLGWLVKVLNTELLVSEFEIPNHQGVLPKDFSVLLNMDDELVEFKEDDIGWEEESESSVTEEEPTLHTCAVRTQGIARFQHFLQSNLSTSFENPTQRRIVTPLDY